MIKRLLWIPLAAMSFVSGHFSGIAPAEESKPPTIVLDFQASVHPLKYVDDLARRAQAVLDERTRLTLPFLEQQQIVGFEGRRHIQLNGGEYGFAFDGFRALLFYQWYPTSGWQQRTEKLYSVAAEVVEALK